MLEVGEAGAREEMSAEEVERLLRAELAANGKTLLPKLIGFGKSLCGGAECGYELTMNAIERTLKKARRWKPWKRTLVAFLCITIGSLWTHAYKRRLLEQRAFDRGRDPDAVANEGSSPERIAILAHEEDDIRAALLRVRGALTEAEDDEGAAIVDLLLGDDDLGDFELPLNDDPARRRVKRALDREAETMRRRA